jgi:hypothetical protein
LRKSLAGQAHANAGQRLVTLADHTETDLTIFEGAPEAPGGEPGRCRPGEAGRRAIFERSVLLHDKLGRHHVPDELRAIGVDADDVRLGGLVGGH